MEREKMENKEGINEMKRRGFLLEKPFSEYSEKEIALACGNFLFSIGEINKEVLESINEVN